MTKNNKVSLNQKFDRNINNCRFDFSKNFKLFSIVSFAIILIAVLMFSFLGFNLNDDYANLSTVKVYTNSENYITETGISSFDINNTNDYNEALKIIENVLKDHNTSIQSIEKTTIDILDNGIKSAKALQITFYNDCSLSNNEIKLLNETIKTELLTSFGYIQEDNGIEIEGAVSNVDIISSFDKNTTSIYTAIIALIVAMVFALIYLSCRYEKGAFVTGFVTIMHDILLTLALITIFRVPFGVASVGVMAFVFVLSVINLIVFYSKSKELTASGMVDKYNVNLVANETVKSNIKFNAYLYATLLVLSILIIVIASAQIRLIALNVLLATIVCGYSAQFILNGFYKIAYKPVKKNRKFI